MTYEALLVIQVRFGSKRLLGKALLPLNGVPVLVYLIRRLKALPQSCLIVVATTKKTEDDLIVAWAEREDVKTFRGQEDDVLARYIKCVEAFSSEVIVRITADNPLTDPKIIANVIAQMKKNKYDYVRAVRGYPIGIGVDAFSGNLLYTSHENSTSAYEREHIDAYVLNHWDKFKTSELPVPPELNYPDIRLTIDTHEDYKNIKKIVESYPSQYFIKAEDAINRAYSGNI